MATEYKIVFLVFALVGLALGQYHQHNGRYPQQYYGQNHAMVVDHGAGTGVRVQLQEAPSRTLIRIPPNTPVYIEPRARPTSQLLSQQSHHRVPVHIERPRETVEHHQRDLVHVEPHQRAPVHVESYQQGHVAPYPQGHATPYQQGHVAAYPQGHAVPNSQGHDAPYPQGHLEPVKQHLSESYSQQLPQVSVQGHSPSPQVYAQSHEVKEQQPIKKGPRYEVIMYEKREFVDPPKSHREHGDKEKAQKYYSYGYGINYGQHAPGQEFEKGYGYVRAYGKAECKEPPCNNKFEFIGNREPYGYRN